MVVTLPDGFWFVVDAFSGARGRSSGDGRPHAVLAFLERFSLSPLKCAFVLLTHLHSDHYEGVPFLLQTLRKSKPDIPLVRHSAYRTTGVTKRIRDHFKAEYDFSTSKGFHVGPRAEEVISLFDRGCLDVSQWDILHSDDVSDCHVMAVAPGETIVNRNYAPEAFSGELPKLKRRHPAEVQKILGRQDTILNDMSVALCVMYGKTCVLLPGDCEKEAWRAIEEKPKPILSRLPGLQDPMATVGFLKAPHHGSGRAWNAYLESIFRQCSFTIATHHKGRNILPDVSGLRQMRESGTAVAVPNRNWLPSEVQPRAQELPNFTAIPVLNGCTGSHLEAESLRRAWGGNIRPELGEVAWVSTSFLKSGASNGHWFGGSDAAFLPPSLVN